MSARPRLKKTRVVVPPLTAASYRLLPITPGKGRKRRNEVRVLLPNGIAMTQQRALPRLPGQVGFQGDRSVSLEDLHRAAEDSQLPMAPCEDGTDSLLMWPTLLHLQSIARNAEGNGSVGQRRSYHLFFLIISNSSARLGLYVMRFC